MLLKLAVKNILTRGSSLVIALFIAFALALFFAGNSVFDSTERGIQETFTRSFTGDFIVRPKTRIPLSLFGDETPVTGDLTDVPVVLPFDDICSFLKNDRRIAGFFPQVSGRALMECGSERIPVAVFGADGKSYVENMSAIRITEGEPFTNGQKGLLLSNTLSARLGATVGTTVQFTVVDGISTRIRALPVCALYDYAVPNQTLEKIVIADDQTVRSLMDIVDMSYKEDDIADDKQNLLQEEEGFFDDDSFFAGSGYTERVTQTQSAIVEDGDDDDGSLFGTSSWNFIVCRIKDGENKGRVIRSVNRAFKKNGWPVQAVLWREAAGSTAIYLFWMRRILNAGIIAILIVGLIIVNNTLVISVLNRTGEIGTLRAVGGSRAFVCLECMAETCMLSLAGSAAGCAAGLFLLRLVNRAGFVFTNQFLVQLFGGEVFFVQAGAPALFRSLVLMLLIAAAGWIYPVQAALKISPVTAMAGE